MNAKDIIYSLDFVKDLSDEELYKLLYENWNITNGKIEVWGELRQPNDKWAGIYNIRTVSENREIHYPIHVIRGDIDSGVFISPANAKLLLNGESSVWVRCELELAPRQDREKHENPFRLSVNRDSAQRLVSLPFLEKTTILTNEVSSYLTEAIYNFHFETANKRLTEALATEELAIEIAEGKRDQVIVQLNHLTEQNKGLEASNTLLQSNISTQQNELIVLHHQYKKIEQEMTKKIERLKSYISEKAMFLKDFEFIDAEDFDNFIVTSTTARDSSKMLSFANILDGNYKQAVSYIQAYLKERDILYPRHIIENYLTLIRSNDLIILAGESGSGKTNLVQSFANAIGGVSKIIPVKPNWTSSEDLLGYYNPLEKKYLATPFLEALIEAQQHPEVPYFICLDEMNLARVEYYFADFLSKLESRDSIPEIQLYSDDESAHVLSELKAVVNIISGAQAKYSKDGIIDFVKLMQDEHVNAEMKRAFGFSDKDSLIKYHGDIRRMLSGIMSTPSTIKVPPNVRIIGAINIDETTHYLSPKILDRAHIMQFKSPLLSDWEKIFSEIESYDFDDLSKPLHFEIDALGTRAAYPKFEREDAFCEVFINLNKEFFSPLGVEFGMRTIRQGLHYLALFSELNGDREQAINNFILHKVLPKFTFDGNKLSGNNNKLNLMDKVLLSRFENIVTNHESFADEFSCVAALKDIIENAKANDGVVNYWA
jgi:energy-coupling factor transporter ATP-binding protein EcfA2